MSEGTINFYSVQDQYGEFSNFALYPIKLKGKCWPTSEHYFQAQKFAGTEHENKIRKSASPMKAAELGRKRKVKIRRDWDKVKDNVMYDAVKAKFIQHKDLKNLLLETEEIQLVEHTENDNYWGDGGDGKGKNMLGKILMRLRDELK
ncbi:NADAR family protein [Chondrinema litorale]|uniref:NADAR family protein n=1 Tax=Chondrinema litorale TaxID=2994555 RepID=UPI0025434756|nr:NADAR family protein [Chondrinema litorale]UZR97940.1 NADAR family protein [Chondrinema litorale]